MLPLDKNNPFLQHAVARMRRQIASVHTMFTQATLHDQTIRLDDVDYGHYLSNGPSAKLKTPLWVSKQGPLDPLDNTLFDHLYDNAKSARRNLSDFANGTASSFIEGRIVRMLRDWDHYEEHVRNRYYLDQHDAHNLAAKSLAAYRDWRTNRPDAYQFKDGILSLDNHIVGIVVDLRLHTFIGSRRIAKDPVLTWQKLLAAFRRRITAWENEYETKRSAPSRETITLFDDLTTECRDLIDPVRLRRKGRANGQDFDHIQTVQTIQNILRTREKYRTLRRTPHVSDDGTPFAHVYQTLEDQSAYQLLEDIQNDPRHIIHTGEDPYTADRITINTDDTVSVVLDGVAHVCGWLNYEQPDYPLFEHAHKKSRPFRRIPQESYEQRIADVLNSDIRTMQYHLARVLADYPNNPTDDLLHQNALRLMRMVPAMKDHRFQSASTTGSNSNKE